MEWILAYGPSLSVALLAVLCVPAGLWLQLPEAHPRAAAQRARAARVARLSPFATGLLAAGLLLPAGRLAGCLALPYAALCATVAAQGLRRLLTLGTVPMPALTLAAAQAYLAGAAVWSLAACAGVPLLGYPPVWVALTAAHFHATGFVLPTVAALLARRRPGRLLTAIAAGIVLGVPLTAAGIYTSVWVERGAGVLLVTATLALAGVLALEARRVAGWRRVGMGVAAASLGLSMPLALLHVLRQYPWLPTARLLDPLSGMVLTHGLLNTLGFAVCALAALRGDVAAHPEAPEGRPHSRLISGWCVGADYFARRGLERPHAAHGLVDTLEALHPQGGRVHAAIRAFYEHTDAHTLTVRPRWAFPPAGALWGALPCRRRKARQCAAASWPWTPRPMAGKGCAPGSAPAPTAAPCTWRRTACTSSRRRRT